SPSPPLPQPPAKPSEPVRNEPAMAKLWFKFQRYFRRKPVRFFTFLVLYLTAGSLVFLHSGFVGQPAVSQNQANPAVGAPAEGAELPFLGDLHLGRGFRDTGEALSITRRYGPWFKGKDGNERAKLGDYGGAWSRALKGGLSGRRKKSEVRAMSIWGWREQYTTNIKHLLTSAHLTSILGRKENLACLRVPCHISHSHCDSAHGKPLLSPCREVG
uniref:WSC domain containing 2 n=1 Tax=Loxodonta africana TaxID=9785 RepID=G3UFA5_LOXAF